MNKPRRNLIFLFFISILFIANVVLLATSFELFGDGTELYNDPGAFRYSPEPYILLYINIVTVLLCGLTYLFTIGNISLIWGSIDKFKERVQESNLIQKLSSVSIKENPSKLELLGLSLYSSLQGSKRII